MFDSFDIQKYLDKKPPSDGSFTTTQEIKELNSIPINEGFVKEKDDIKASFLKLSNKKGLDISGEDLDEVIDKSAKVVLKIKKHHNRPRPKVLAKKNNIKFKDKELDSMKTPSYPSGHSVQGILIAKLIGDKFPKHAKEFLKLGKDISYSRNVAHAHYKSDSKFGEQLGKDMFEHLKSANATLKSKNEKSSPAKLLKGKKKKQKDNKKQTNNTVTIPDNAITASHSDQAIARKKFQNANNKVIPKGTKVTFNKTTGKYTYYYVPSDSPVKKATRKVCLPKAKIASMSSSEKQKVINAKKAAASKGKQVRSSKSFIRDGSTKSKGLRDWVKQDWRQVGNPSKKCGEK